MRKLNSLICASALCLASGPLLAAEMSDKMKTEPTAGSQSGDELQNAQETVQEAAKVVEKLRTDSETKDVLSEAKAIFIVPDYGRAALGIGASGGQGVLVANNQGEWSGPAFFNIGAVNLGLAAGAEAGSIAFLVMSENALKGFRDEHNFSLNADAGLTIVNWSERGQASAGKGADVIVWADTKGLYGDLAVSVADIFADKDANQAYYKKDVSANEIAQGTVKDPMSSSPLEAEFAAMEAGKPTSDKPMGTTPHSDAPMGSEPRETPMGSDPAERPQGIQ